MVKASGVIVRSNLSYKLLFPLSAINSTDRAARFLNQASKHRLVHRPFDRSRDFTHGGECQIANNGVVPPVQGESTGSQRRPKDDPPSRRSRISLNETAKRASVPSLLGFKSKTSSRPIPGSAKSS